MKKLERLNLSSIIEEFAILEEETQRRILGGTGASDPPNWDCMFNSLFSIGVRGIDGASMNKDSFWYRRLGRCF